MQAMKGRFLKNLKFIPTISSLKQSIAHLKSSNQKLQSPQIIHQELDQRSCCTGNNAIKIEESESLECNINVCNKESTVWTSSADFKDEENVMDDENSPRAAEKEEEEEEENSEENNTIASEFEEKCPPGGEELVVLYTTSLRGVRKTYEDCHSIRFLLENLRVLYYERDVSCHMEYREELWRTLGGRVIPPKLFIKGRYIGGADEVIALHEQGKLKKLLEGIPVKVSNRHCCGCGNLRFVVCFSCNGSRKVFAADGEGGGGDDQLFVRCIDCNENGLVKCQICC